MKIAHPSGVWLQNTAMYRCHDHETATFFEPGEPTKALETTFTKAQAAIIRVADPTLSEAEITNLQGKLAKLNAETQAEREQLEAEADARRAEDNARLLGEQPDGEKAPFIEDPLVVAAAEAAAAVIAADQQAAAAQANKKR